MSTAVLTLRSTPAGEPVVPELVQAGDVVRTNYGTGPFRVIEVAGPYGHGCYSLILLSAKESGTKSWINELVAVGRRLLKLHVSNDDEVFVISKGGSPLTTKQKPSKAAASKTPSQPPKAKVKPKAEHYSETPIITPAARLTIYTAQDPTGQYYGGFSIEWAFVSLASQRTALTPSKCKKFALLDDAFGHQLHEARDFTERLRLNHLTDEQLAAIQVVEAAIDERKVGPSLRDGKEIDSRSESPTLADELQRLTWDEAKIECDLIDRHPQNRDVPIPSVADLAESIRRTGRVLERVKVRDLGDGRYQMLSGERRWKAVQLLLDWPTIDADVATMSDAAARALLTICNTQRQDLNDIEKARDLQQLCLPVDEGGAGMTQEEAGDLYSLSQSHVANLIRLLAAPESLLQLVIAGEMPSSFLRLALPYLAIKGMEKQIVKDVVNWHKGSGEPGEKAIDRVPTRDQFHDELKRMARTQTRPLTPSKLDWWGADSAKYERDRMFDLTPEVDQQLGIVDVDLYDGKHPRATNVKLWDKLQKAAIPAAIKKWKDKKNKKADRSSKGKKAESRELTAAERKVKEARDAESLSRRVADWRRDWLLRLIGEQLPSAPPITIAVHFRGVTVTPPGLRDAALELFDEGVDCIGVKDNEPPMLSFNATDELAQHCGIDVEAEWSGMQKGTPPIEFETFFQLHDKSQLERVAGELKVNIVGLDTKKKLVTMLTSQPRTLPLPKSIATLKPATKKPRGKK